MSQTERKFFQFEHEICGPILDHRLRIIPSFSPGPESYYGKAIEDSFSTH